MWVMKGVGERPSSNTTGAKARAAGVVVGVGVSLSGGGGGAGVWVASGPTASKGVTKGAAIITNSSSALNAINR